MTRNKQNKEHVRSLGKRVYVLDTNVLMSDPESLFSFDEHDVIIPMIVLEELDRHKSRSDEIGKNVRQVTRTLDNLRSRGSLMDGVALDNGGCIKVGRMSVQSSEPGLDPNKPDNLIIDYARNNAGCTLVSKDINVRVKCDSLGIPCEDYLKMRVADDPQKFYRGVETIELPEHVVDTFYQTLSLPLPFAQFKAYPNQIVIIKSVKNGQTTRSAITKASMGSGVPDALVPVAKIESAFGLKPRNKEQSFSLDLLFDDKIKLLTLVGPSGTGKTLLALAAALEQLKGSGSPENAKYDKLIVTRPVQPVGKDIGFLPGTMQEKMEPWIAPIRDNLNFLMDVKRNKHVENPKKNRYISDDSYLSSMQDRGLIEIEAITFIRGRSIPNAFIVIDEAQNLSIHELKTIVTRVGDGTKIVLTGDIDQIDNVHVDVYTNGLSCAVEKFKEHPIAGHVTLLKGERSQLATLASKIL